VAKVDVRSLAGAGRIRRLAVARLLSNTGSAAAAVALAFYMYNRTGSPYWLAGILLFTFGISGVFSPIAGLIADTFDRQKVMIASDWAGALCWTGLVLVDRPWVLLPLAFVASIVRLPFSVASGAAAPNIVAEPGLTWANGLLSAAGNVANLVGPLLGGLLYSVGGKGLPFIVNAASFIVSAILVTTIRAPFSASGSSRRSRRGALAGFRIIFASRPLAALTAWWALGYFALNIAFVADVPLANAFHVGSVGYSTIDAAFGVGLMLGTLATRYIKAGSEWFWVRCGAVGVAVGWATISVTPWFALVLIGSVVAAVLDGIGGTAGFTVYQQASSDEVRGRVLAAVNAVGLMANVVGFGLAGALTAWIGFRGVYAVGAGAAMVGVALLLTVLPTVAPAEQPAT
jgi:MFS family permease